jgi:hypothetical protein
MLYVIAHIEIVFNTTELHITFIKTLGLVEEQVNTATITRFKLKKY